MTLEQAILLLNHLESATHSAKELLKEIKRGGSVDFEKDTRGATIVNDIEFDVSQAAKMIEGL